jgi:hypothetical protein
MSGQEQDHGIIEYGLRATEYSRASATIRSDAIGQGVSKGVEKIYSWCHSSRAPISLTFKYPSSSCGYMKDEFVVRVLLA